jgi:hypothetical protein
MRPLAAIRSHQGGLRDRDLLPLVLLCLAAAVSAFGAMYMRDLGGHLEQTLDT